MGASTRKGRIFKSVGISGKWCNCTLGKRSNAGMGFEPVQKSEAPERRKNASHTSITNQVSYETVLCETLGMVHHSGATANVAEDQDGD